MSQALPQHVYSCEQVREIDHRAIKQANIPGISLMRRAAKAAFSVMMEKWPSTKAISVFCGGGNNGGDGYIVAGLAAQRNLEVHVYALVPPSTLVGDAMRAYQFALEQGAILSPVSSFACSSDPSTLIVDAIVGTGVKGELRYAEVVALINQSVCPVVALDLPSGLDGDTGASGQAVVQADITVSFVGLKRGLVSGRGPALRGELIFSDLGIPPSCYEGMPFSASIMTPPRALPPRDKSAHKGEFGHVLVIGGDSGMGGAALLAAEAALRCGAGKVSLATQPEHVAPALARLPEVMVSGMSSGLALQPLLAKADVLVLGPGLGRSSWSKQLLYFALQSNLPVIVDADALNMLGLHDADKMQTHRWIMTPHPGEAGSLLDCSAKEIQSDRFSAVKALQKKFDDSVVVLKGAGSLVADSESIYIANVGNPGMAVAGMGDVLSGVIGALVAQGLSRIEAAKSAVYMHAAAGDLAVKESGEKGLLASDVIPYVRQMINGMS